MGLPLSNENEPVPSEGLHTGHRQQHHPPRGDDRERITSARQAAEALFTPKRQPAERRVAARRTRFVGTRTQYTSEITDISLQPRLPQAKALAMRFKRVLSLGHACVPARV
jgi:hypothetical protein